MRMALSKGYLLTPTVELLAKIGIEIDPSELNSRKLTFSDTTGAHEFVIIRPADVPVYVEHGAVDIGIAGKDVLMESGLAVAELLDLRFGYCRLVLAVREDSGILSPFANMRIATKFVHIVEEYFNRLDLNVELIKLYGSVELAPIAGLSDAIADLTATGTSLRENNLKIVDTIMESTARLIANKVRLKTHYDEIIDFAQRLIPHIPS